MLFILMIALLAGLCPGLSPGSASAASAASNVEIPKGYVKLAENDRLMLFANVKKADFAVVDKQAGETWWSNPQDRASDKVAKGAFKMALNSQITVKYANEKNEVQSATSAVSVGTRGKLTYKKLSSGIEFTMDFKKEQFSIPVRYTLTNDYLKAAIMTERIKEYGTNKVLSIALLPYFGAGGKTDTGYMLVPDGSGALIQFNNGKKFADEFSMPVYGTDYNYDRAFVDSYTEQVAMPVFGMKKNESGFAAVIAGNEAGGTVKAAVSGKTTSYNNVYSEYQYRSMGSMTLTQKNFGEKDVNIVERNPENRGSFEVRYYFLSGSQSDYNGMAAKYRQFLIDEKHLKQTATAAGDIPFYVDVYGYVKKKKAFLGFPYQKVIPLTTFQDAQQIIKELKDGGISNTVLRYNGWLHNAYLDRVPSGANVEKKLGGRKGLAKLTDQLKQSGGQLFMNVDFLNVYHGGNGFSRFRDAAMTVVNLPAMQYEYKLNVYDKDNDKPAWYLLAPRALSKFTTSFLNAFKRLNLPDVLKLSFASVGTMVYSDLGLSGTSKTAVPAYYEQALQQAKEQTGGVMTDGGNAYTIPYSQHIVHVPASSSHLDIEDESVPFFQIVLHGWVPYAGSPVNLSSSPEEAVLRSLETGSNPMYAWVGKNTEELADTKLNFLFSADYRTWMASAVKAYNEVNPILSKVAASAIVKHQKLEEGVYQTDYENGMSVIGNYNSDAVLVGGKEVAGGGYLVLNQGR